MRERVWSVGELIDDVNSLLESGYSGVVVEGEIAQATRSSRGHVYFTLRDGDAQLDCVAWASTAGRFRFELDDGLAVRATGQLTVYRARGRFQLVVSSLEPQGQGALQLAFEQLKKRLEAEGLFAPERKRPLPPVPQRVGIVTSPTGAALRDMLKVLRRHAHVEVVVAPATVQGERAASEIAEAIGRLGRSGLVDVVIAGRGGGSLEDLWAFNEEPVARAIAVCPVPVVSGVGHEVDFTVADFVADVRAATPTQAAEIVLSVLEDKERRVAEAPQRLAWELRRHLKNARSRLDAARGSAGLSRVPHRIQVARLRLDSALRLPNLLRDISRTAEQRLVRAQGALRRFPGLIAAGGHRRLVDSRTQLMATLVRNHLARARREVETRQQALEHLSPRKILERGYSITTVEGRTTPLKEARSLRKGQTLMTTLAHGAVRSIVVTADDKRRVTPESRRGDEPEQQTLFDDGGQSD